MSADDDKALKYRDYMRDYSRLRNAIKRAKTDEEKAIAVEAMDNFKVRGPSKAEKRTHRNSRWGRVPSGCITVDEWAEELKADNKYNAVDSARPK